MGTHPAHCDCGDIDRRVVQCPGCDRDVVRGQVCPHCYVDRGRYEAVVRLLGELRMRLHDYERLHGRR